MLDQLTGMLNRHGLSEYLEKNYNETSQQAASLIIIDIDYFKRINDAHGHDGGDIVLREVANIIRQNIRSKDTAARWGGEEFVVLLPHTEIEDARAVAEELRSQVAKAVFDMPPISQVTISAGVGMINGDEPFHMLFRRVDIALYQAKAQGRNRVIMAVN
jgi:diguanylate cyclase (GGDEF)-like protein